MDLQGRILQLLNEVENSLKCILCNENCKDPVRIKTCGHYFCELCLKNCNLEHKCPKCSSFYVVKDLDKENIARECKPRFQELRTLLENISESENKSNFKRQTRSSNNDKKPLYKYKEVSVNKCSKTSDNVFIYDNKRYHIHFVNLLSTKTNAKGETQLHLACKKGKINEVRHLLKQEVDLNAKDYAGWAPLHEAIQSNNVEIVELLLQNGCLFDIPGADFTTPIHQATSLGNIEMVSLLLKYGADINLVDYTGMKPVNSTANVTIKKALDSATSKLEERTFNLYLSSDVYLYCHSIDEEYKNKLLTCKNLHVMSKMNVNKKLTHLVIKKTHKMSFKILQGMLEGLFFIEQDSIDDYIAGHYFLDIPNYVFLTNYEQLNRGIKKAMISALLKLPKLFDGISFFIEDHNIPVDIYHLKVDKEYLARLIKTGGGKVLHRPPALRTCESERVHPYFAPNNSSTYWCCNYILFAESNRPELTYNMKELQHKSSKWLIDCIVKYEICD